MNTRPVIVWFRRSLRLADHPALHAAAASGAPVIPVYILDDTGDRPAGGAARWWLGRSLAALAGALEKRGSRLILRRGAAAGELTRLAGETEAGAVYFTRSYEPDAAQLEKELKSALEAEGVECRRFGGALLTEPETVRNASGEPFRVFTPFYKACLQKESIARPLAVPERIAGPANWPDSEELESWKLEPRKPDWAKEMRRFWTPGEDGAAQRLAAFIDGPLGGYAQDRDRPDLDGSSRISPHLAFGEIGPRQVWNAVRSAAERNLALGKSANSFIRELYWREFSAHLLFHWPDLPHTPFRLEFTHIPWRCDKAGLHAWRKGLTGYPLVDAGMRQLWAIGWMHNRVRMVAASLLTKHLLIDWREGEAWFWDTLVDADAANNAASWQWVAGSGADAAPYFRVFNPIIQGAKFDPEGNYVRRWVPELAEVPAEHIHAPWNASEEVLRRAGVTLGATYPLPLISHEEGRRRALEAYEAVKAAKS